MRPCKTRIEVSTQGGEALSSWCWEVKQTEQMLDLSCDIEIDSNHFGISHDL